MLPARYILAAAVAAISIPASVQAVPILANQSYTEVGTIMPGASTTFTFEVMESLQIGAFSLSATGTNSGLDVADVDYGLDASTPLTFGINGTVSNVGTAGAGYAFLDGGVFSMGDLVTIYFGDGIEDEVGLTVSFTTSDVPPVIPLPATGVLMLSALAGAGAVASRKKKRSA